MADESMTMLEQLAAQLQSEIKSDAAAVAENLRADFATRTTELTGTEATAYAQNAWLEGKGLRNVEEIDRLGPEKWWGQVFEHVATNVTPDGKRIFLEGIRQGIDYVDALHFATVLGGMEPPQAVVPPTAFGMEGLPAQPGMPEMPPPMPMPAPPPPAPAPMPMMPPPLEGG